jgi:hypothetical protein
MPPSNVGDRFLRRQIAFFAAGLVTSLAFANIVTSPAFAETDSADVSGLSGGNVRGLSGGNVRGLSGGNVRGLSGGNVRGLSGGNVRGLSGGNVRGLSGGNVRGLSGGNVRGLSGGNVRGLSGGNVRGLSGGNVRGLSGGNVRGLSGGNLRGFELGAVGPIESIATSKNGATVVVLGQQFETSLTEANALSVGDYVLAGVADEITTIALLGEIYIPGASPVLLKGEISATNRAIATVAVGGVLLDYSAVLSDQPDLIPAVGVGLEAQGVQPQPGSVVVLGATPLSDFTLVESNVEASSASVR